MTKPIGELNPKTSTNGNNIEAAVIIPTVPDPIAVLKIAPIIYGTIIPIEIPANKFITISCKLDNFNTVANAPPAPTIKTIFSKWS